VVAASVAVAVAVAASRVLLDFHWLSDVIGGLSLGWAWFALCSVVFGGRLLTPTAGVDVAAEAAAPLRPIRPKRLADGRGAGEEPTALEHASGATCGEAGGARTSSRRGPRADYSRRGAGPHVVQARDSPKLRRGGLSLCRRRGASRAGRRADSWPRPKGPLATPLSLRRFTEGRVVGSVLGARLATRPATSLRFGEQLGKLASIEL
jgi:hypothetical protein